MKLYLFLFFSLILTAISAQELRINEAMASNIHTIFDEDGASSDWIEIHNAGSESVDLDGYALSDDSSFENPWIFPSFILNPDQYLLVFASDKDRVAPPLFWETVIDVGDEWHYFVPDSDLSIDWNTLSFDDSAWLIGKTSIGYGDGDDSTLVDEGTISVFMRKTFDITSTIQITDGILHVDYDDGFVAYLNGTEIARSGLAGDNPVYDEVATSHDAVMYQGGSPESFPISNIKELLIEGENVISVQVHNAGSSSSDMTIIPILSFGSGENRGGELSEYLSATVDNFHTNFKISSSGDSIFLRGPELDIIDTLVTGVLAADISIGLALDGSGDLQLFDEPTPGEANSSNGYSSSITSGEVIFSQPAGYYSGSVQIEMSSGMADDPIYFTTDGSIPLLSSALYIAPIEISENTVLKARVINGGSLPGKTATASYLIDVNHDLPIISISVDPDDFFDETEGMYMLGPNASNSNPYFGANFWLDWEKPVHVEMFEENGEKAFSAHAGAKVFGGWSRGWSQKSLSIFFRNSYGDGPITYQLFPEKDIHEFSSIVLRNSGNDWGRSMFRDGLLSTLFHESVDTQEFRPSVVYINGVYWGIHNIREKVNEHFIAANHGLESDSIEIVEFLGDPVTGSAEHYWSLLDYTFTNNLSLEANYEYVQTQMDVRNYLYYMSTNIFINNYDWPAYNIKFWRENSNTGRWRWIAFDKDAGFGIWNVETYSDNNLTPILTSPDWPAPLFHALMKNESCKNLFINIYADQLNTSWKAEVIHDEIDEKRALIEGEMPNHISRWNNNEDYGEDSGLDYDSWTERVNVLYTYAIERPAFAIDHIIEAFDLSGDFNVNLDVSNGNHGSVRINTIEPTNYPWDGTYFNEVPIEVEARPMPGYRFVRWEGAENETNSKVKLTTSSDISLKAIFEDAGDVSDFLVINEINYNATVDIEDWVELFNKDFSPINLSGWILKDDDDLHSFEFPEGTIISARSYLVICRDERNFAFHYPGISNYIGEMDFGLSGNGDCVRLFDSDGQLVEEVCYEETLPWPEEANGQGSTLALFDTELNNTDPSNWYAEPDNGNPGEANRLITALQGNNLIDQLLIYPNPASQKIQITFNLHKTGKTDLSILDLSGKNVFQLVSKNLSAGTHEFTWVPSESVESGIYLIRLESHEDVFLKKLILKR